MDEEVSYAQGKTFLKRYHVRSKSLVTTRSIAGGIRREVAVVGKWRCGDSGSSVPTARLFFQ